MPGRGLRIHDGDPVPVLGTLSLPAIVLLRGNHFAVIEAVAGDGTVAVNDPARGRHDRTGERFRAEFSGIVLTFEAGLPVAENASRGVPRWSAVRLCAEWLAVARYRVAAAVVAGLLLGAVTAGLAVAVEAVVAGHLTAGAAAVVLGVAAVLCSTLAYGQRRLLNSVQEVVARRRKRDVLGKLLTVPSAFLNRRSSAALGTQARFAETAAVLLAHRVVPLLAAAASLLPVAIVLGWLAWPVLLLGICGGLTAAALRSAGRRRSADARRLFVGELTRRSGLARTAFGRLDAVRAEHSEPDLIAEFGQAQQEELAARRQAAGRARCWAAAATAVEPAVVGAAAGLAGPLARLGWGSPATMLAALVVLVPFLLYGRTVLDNLGELPEFLGRLNVLEDLDQATPDARFVREATPEKSTVDGTIELADVTFGYSNRRQILQGVTVTVPAGGRLVVTGAPGCGKSTLLKLIAGALDPVRGEIRLGGSVYADIPRAALRDGVGYVPQTPWLFAGTVHDNLTLFDDIVTDGQVARALEDARLSEVVMRRGGARGAKVEPGGRNFSGGERCRLALARALLRDPAVVLLDEPHSSWDPALALEIGAVLRRRAVTTVLTTASMDLVSEGDQVLTIAVGHAAGERVRA
jgi:ABC-type bacteriocin/lantibiotic exporter with double-glycine peptidase domain